MLRVNESETYDLHIPKKHTWTQRNELKKKIHNTITLIYCLPIFKRN